MNINKFEAIGIGVSVAAMAVALLLIRIDGLGLDSETESTADQQASVVVAENDNVDAARADAILQATNGSDNVERLIVDDVVLGEGAEVEEGDTVSVHYIGTLQNGQQFDNSYLDEEPLTFTVGAGAVIAGWEQGVVGMKEGGRRILVVPPELAYGSEGYGPIPGDATLVFAVELMEIK